MENQIDLKYFYGLLALPYANMSQYQSGPSSQAVDTEQSELTRYIKRYQKEFFIKLFGEDAIPDDIDGLTALLVDEETLVSPIANYVFCQVLPIYQSRATAAGEELKGNDNGQRTNYSDRYCMAWNDMVRMCADIRELIYDAGKHDDYPTNASEDIYTFKYVV